MKKPKEKVRKEERSLKGISSVLLKSQLQINAEFVMAQYKWEDLFGIKRFMMFHSLKDCLNPAENKTKKLKANLLLLLGFKLFWLQSSMKILLLISL
jgi:hypothetical protein